MHGVHRQHRTVEVERGQKLSGRGDLVASLLYADLSEYDSGVVVECGDQMRGCGIGSTAGTANGLAVQCDQTPPASEERAGHIQTPSAASMASVSRRAKSLRSVDSSGADIPLRSHARRAALRLLLRPTDRSP